MMKRKGTQDYQWYSDGGDLNNVVYYDEQGNILYAVYASTSENMGNCIHAIHKFI